jgi:hypothetical protein
MMAKENTTLHNIVIISRTGVKAERNWKNKITKTAAERIITISGISEVINEWLS